MTAPQKVNSLFLLVFVVLLPAWSVAEEPGRGFGRGPAARKNRPVPVRDAADGPAGERAAAAPRFINPEIVGYGKVVPLPAAAQQPRSGSKLVVDVTKGGGPDKLNPAVEKVARFVNIYRGAGKVPAKVKIAVVLHGDATLTVLNSDAYAKRFGVKANPNADCLHKLHEAGVEIYVCGQSLIGKGGRPGDVLVFCDVAVSALTSLVNLQQDGHGYVPLGN